MSHPLGELPTSIWLADKDLLRLPPQLAAAYATCLETNGLLAQAQGPRPDPAPVGGFSQEQTDLHFAHAFDGSVARVELALVDPNQKVPATSRTLTRFLSGGSLCLVDVPCGAGAASLSLISTICELRKAGLLPRLPLNIHVIGGEISGPARVYADALLAALKANWATEGVFVTHELMSWDVLSEVSNGELVEKIVLRKSHSPQTLVVVSNFSGFLVSTNKMKSAQPQLGELFKFASGLMNAAVWIEPATNAATKGLIPWLVGVLSKWKLFASLIDAGPDATCECTFESPIVSGDTAKVRLCVLPIDLVRQNA